MRYSSEHKSETRRRVVEAAALAVRANGPDGVSVADVMSEVGLTHGGFYAHFPSKAALVAAAVADAFRQSRERFAGLTQGLSPSAALEAFVDAYVSPEHRLRVARGCPVAALSSELPRQGPEVRQAYEAGVKGMIRLIGGWLPEGPDREGLAASLVAEMAGAVTLSRAYADDGEAEQFLRGARRQIKTRMGIVQ